MCCPPSRWRCSSAARRRPCRSWPGSTRGRSARCGSCCRRSRRARRPMRRRSAQLTAIWPTNCCALYPSGDLAEAMLATAAGRHVRLDRRAAGAQPDGGRAGRRSCTISITAIRPPTRRGLHAFHASEIPYVFGDGGPDAAALAGDPGHGGGSRTVRRHAGLLGQLRAGRRSVAPRVSRTGGPMARAAPIWPSPARRGRATHLMPGMFELIEEVVCRRRAPAAICRGTGTSGVVSPPLPASRRNVHDRRGDAGLPPDPRPVPGSCRQMASGRRGGHGAGRRFESTRIGYAALRARSRKVSAVLDGLGVKPGDRVATLAWNTQAHVEVWYAVMGMGAVCHTLNPRLTEAQLADMATRSQARDPDRERGSGAARAPHRRAGAADRARAGDRCGRDATSRPICWSRMIGAAEGEVVWGAFDETAPSGLCFTSGTTGRAQGRDLHPPVQLPAYAAGAAGGRDGVHGRRTASWWRCRCSTPTPGACRSRRPAVGARLVLPGRYLDGASLAG